MDRKRSKDIIGSYSRTAFRRRKRTTGQWTDVDSGKTFTAQYLERHSFSDNFRTPLDYNPCDHSVMKVRHLYGSLEQPAISPLGTYDRYNCDLWQVLDTYDPAIGFVSVSGSESESQLADRAVKSMLSGLKPQVNVYNMLIDLVSFRGLFKSSIASTFEKGLYRRKKLPKTPKTRQQFYKLSRKRGLEGYKQFYRDLSSDYLAFSFGWVPLLSDLDTLCKIHQRIAKVKIEKVSRLPIHIHGQALTKQYEKTVAWRANPATGCYIKDIATRGIHVSASAVYYWNNSTPLSRAEEISMYSNMLGLHCVAGAIWEAIPFSFVADWFVPVSQIMDLIDDNVDYYHPQLDFVRQGYSICDRQETTRLYGLQNCGNPELYGDGIPARTIVTRSRFKRTVITDLCAYSKNLRSPTGLTTKRTSYVLALLGQKTR